MIFNLQRKSVSGPQKQQLQEADTQGDDNFNTKPGTESGSNEYLKTNETCFSQAVSSIEYLNNKSALIG